MPKRKNKKTKKRRNAQDKKTKKQRNEEIGKATKRKKRYNSTSFQ